MARIEAIITITEGGILYRDIAGVTRWIDFYDCASNRDHYMSDTGKRIKRCVGWRSYYEAELAYIEFFTVPLLRLEFDSPDSLYDLLKEMYERGGWAAYNLDEHHNLSNDKKD
ncbi:MAG: hypothetical protein ACPG7F_17325 [Aggregatilineales bacterium]